MIEDDRRNTLYQDYTASMIGTLVTQIARFCGVEAEAPNYIEMVYPADMYRGKQETAQEIKDRLLARLN